MDKLLDEPKSVDKSCVERDKLQREPRGNNESRSVKRTFEHVLGQLLSFAFKSHTSPCVSLTNVMFGDILKAFATLGRPRALSLEARTARSHGRLFVSPF